MDHKGLRGLQGYEFGRQHRRCLRQAGLVLLAAVLIAGASAPGCGARRNAPRYQLPVPPVARSVKRPSVYRLEQGDVLNVRFLYHQEINSSPTVRPDGKITIAGLGEFDALGLTTEELETDVFRRASLTYRNPNLSVLVTEHVQHRAYVGGEVKRPGYVALSPGITSLRAIMTRGGFLNSAKASSVLHIRWDPDGGYSARLLDLKNVLETGDAREDIALGPNDVVYVPATAIANADRWVDQYVIQLIPVRRPTTRLPDVPAP